MPRQTYVFRDGGLVLKDAASPLCSGEAASPHVIRDGMDATWHPATGETFESKSAFRKATRRAGCLEIGEQAGYGQGREAPRLSRDDRARDVKRAIEQLRSR